VEVNLEFPVFRDVDGTPAAGDNAMAPEGQESEIIDL
jgi:hypothetical protein